MHHPPKTCPTCDGRSKIRFREDGTALQFRQVCPSCLGSGQAPPQAVLELTPGHRVLVERFGDRGLWQLLPAPTLGTLEQLLQLAACSATVRLDARPHVIQGINANFYEGERSVRLLLTALEAS